MKVKPIRLVANSIGSALSKAVVIDTMTRNEWIAWQIQNLESGAISTAYVEEEQDSADHIN